MHRLRLSILFGLCSVAGHAQGMINFQNTNVPGLPGSPSYNVPIWAYGSNGLLGAGTLHGGVTVGLFEITGTTPLVTSQLRTDVPNAPLFANPIQTATTSYPAGSSQTLIVRAWQTSFGTGLAGFNAAKNSAGGQWREWSFKTQPLGGISAADGRVIPTPGMTGWGPGAERGGFSLIPEPSTVALALLGLGLFLVASKKQ